MKKALVTLMLLFTHASAMADFAQSWDQAKRYVWQVYKDNRVDQYCGCRLGSKNAPDLKSCGYEPRKNPQRAARTEIEHVVPAENLGRQFVCWRVGGRDHCNATDPEFRRAHNDLHNLMPVIGEVNGDRSNFRFDEIADRGGQYGQCDFKVDFQNRRAEPPASLKGDIARIHFYMRDSHGLRLSGAQERLFEIWNRQDPVSQWEIIRNERISKIQGTSNPYVTGAVVANNLPERTTSKPVVASTNANQVFDCSRKACSAMTSCSEALHKLTICDHKQLDGNGDGVPCEALCK